MVPPQGLHVVAHDERDGKGKLSERRDERRADEGEDGGAVFDDALMGEEGVGVGWDQAL